jgi:protoporphyrinogen oxidase
MKEVVIIGAGPAGLTAGYELLKTGEFNVTILEESTDFGGISKTINANDNYMDIGGHRFFSKDKRVIDWWFNLFKQQSKPSKDDIILGRNKEFSTMDNMADPETNDRVMLIRERVSRIYYKGVLFDYPVTLNWDTIRNMGFITTIRAGFSYLYTLFHKLPENNLENFYINCFGKVLYSMFFEGYTKKIWGRHPREISAEWGAQRVKGLSIKAILKDIFERLFHLKNRKIETSLIERFHYPKLGPGQFWTVVTDEIHRMNGKVLTGKCATGIILNNDNCARKVICSDGSEFICDFLISSMPVKDLLFALDNVPSDIKRIAKDLPYRDFQTVGILLPADKFLLRNKRKIPTVGGITPDCWIYVQDVSVSIGRIQIFNNWSPYMVKDFENTVWIGLEYFCNEGDNFWEMPDEEYISFAVSEIVKIGVIAAASDILFAHRERVKKAYPAYFDSYTKFAELRKFLDNIPNLYCVGRNGQHRYNNMDHSMATAFETVNCIKNSRTDKTFIWNVNTEQEYHEGK